MVSIIELSNKTSIDSSLYSFHTLEGGVQPIRLFIKQQDKPYDHITNAVVSELKLLIQTKIPS